MHGGGFSRRSGSPTRLAMRSRSCSETMVFAAGKSSSTRTSVVKKGIVRDRAQVCARTGTGSLIDEPLNNEADER